MKASIVNPGRKSLPGHRAWIMVALTTVALLSACGGGEDGAASGAVTSSARIEPVVTALAPVPASPPPESSQQMVPSKVSTKAPRATAPSTADADPGVLLLLVPDDLGPTDPGVAAWQDAASELGVRMRPVSDSQFLAMGTSGAMQYAGLVLPDSIHSVAANEIVAAVHDYTRAGGKTFLTFDFAALEMRSDGAVVFPIPKSRLSDMAGVDYVLYDKYRDKTTGLGPVTAMRSTLRELLVPPGKSETYPPAPSPSATLKAQALSTGGQGVPLLRSAGVGPSQSLYLAPSLDDPGGIHGFDPQQYQMLHPYSVKDRAVSPSAHAKPRSVSIDFGRAFKGAAPVSSSPVLSASSAGRVLAGTEDGNAVTAVRQKAAAAPFLDPTQDVLQAYSGYLLGYLIYPTYQTEGVYAGTTLATSPSFGLVAGISNVGAGKVMFVNLPLTYLKGRTDALPMHGFLNYFLKYVVDGIRLSAVPNAVPGITFNWHLDSMEAQEPMLALEQAGVFRRPGTSMHMTAGPDTVTIGDGLGFDLDHNPTAQAFLRRMDRLGHSVGSHGGWDHDYYGLNANETNEATFLPYLILNRISVDNVLGHASRDYSAPVGNNPIWAMQWLESQGVVGAYFGGHTGLGVTRQYRDGVLMTPKLWVAPVTPFGHYATFEEWQEFNVPKADVIAWYQSMVDFDIAQNTSRLVYAHPPGAYEWLDVMQNFLAYVRSKGAANFKWYSIERLADFMTTRRLVTWTETPLAGGATQFVAKHPSSLSEMVWSLPKNRYLKPTMLVGARVVDGGDYWLVKANAVTSLQFQVSTNPKFN